MNRFFFFFLVAFLLTACATGAKEPQHSALSSTAVETPILSDTTSPTPIPSFTPQPTETPSPTPQPTESPSPTPTISYPVAMNTPWPLPEKVITAGNLDKLVSLANLGYGLITDVAYSPDYSQFTVSTTMGLYFYDSRQTTLTKSLADRISLLSLAYSPDGRTLAVGTSENTIQLWDISTYQLIRTVELPFDKSQNTQFDGVYQISYSLDGQVLQLSGRENFIDYVMIWDLQRNKSLASFEKVDGCNLKISPDDMEYAIAGKDKVQTFQLPAEGTNSEAKLKAEYSFLNANNLEYSPDGKIMAVITNEVITLLKTADGSTLGKISGKSLEFSPKSTTFLTSTASGAFQLWNVSYAENKITPAGSFSGYGFGRPVYGINSCSAFMRFQKWIIREPGFVHYGIFSPDGEFVAVLKNSHCWMNCASPSTTQSDKLLVYKVSDGSLYKTIQVPTDGFENPNFYIQEVRFSQNQVITISSEAPNEKSNVLRVWDLETGKLIKAINPIGPEIQLAFSQDNKYLVSFAPNGLDKFYSPDTTNGDIFKTTKITEFQLARWDISKSSVISEYNGFKSINSYRCCDASYSVDGNSFAFNNFTYSYFWQTSSGQAAGTEQNITYSPGGYQAIAHGSDIVLSKNGTNPTTLKGHPKYILSLAFSPDGTLLASGDDDGNIFIWNVQNGTLNQKLNAGGRILKLRISLHNQNIWGISSAKSGWMSGTLFEGDIISGNIIRNIDSGDDMNFDYSPNGSIIVSTASGMGTIFIKLYTSDGALLRTVVTPYQMVFASPYLAFSPNGTMLAIDFPGGVQIMGIDPAK